MNVPNVSSCLQQFKNYKNRVCFSRVVITNVQLTFFGPPCICTDNHMPPPNAEMETEDDDELPPPADSSNESGATVRGRMIEIRYGDQQ